jgi:hypothetical protein
VSTHAAAPAATDLRRWDDRRTGTAVAVALAVGAGLGVVAGLRAGIDLIVRISERPELGVVSRVEIVQGFDWLVAIQVFGVVALLVGLTTLGALRLGFVEPVDRSSLTRRRALLVGLVGAIAMLAPWLYVGVQGSRVFHTTSGGPVGFGGAAAPPPESFYVFQTVPALIAMIAIFGAVASFGSAFRRPSAGRSEPGAPTPS